MRNISTAMIFDPETYNISVMHVGGFARQHDPDYMPDGRISVFDDNNIGPEEFGQQSRILAISAESAATEILYSETEAKPSYTGTMGKSQWLPNGNLLVTESMQGRAFEVTSYGSIVWEYFDLVGDGQIGLLQEVQRLPEKFNSNLRASISNMRFTLRKLGLFN
jgi:hypothetical protein